MTTGGDSTSTRRPCCLARGMAISGTSLCCSDPAGNRHYPRQCRFQPKQQTCVKEDSRQEDVNKERRTGRKCSMLGSTRSPPWLISQNASSSRNIYFCIIMTWYSGGRQIRQLKRKIDIRSIKRSQNLSHFRTICLATRRLANRASCLAGCVIVWREGVWPR